MKILDAAISADWAMEEFALARVLEIAGREHMVTPSALSAYRAEAMKNAERATVRDGVAILNVEGPLFKKANLMTEFCGATSYESLMRDFHAALDDGKVRAILLNVDSPGGEARGVGEFASAVRAARGKKPIVAYAGDLAASAAYWIASAADRIVTGPGAALGSIGVRATFPDTRERDARSGVRSHTFVSSQSPFKVSDPSTKDGAERIKSRVDALAQVFVDAVADNRGVSVAHVLDAFGKGDVLIGAEAVAAGMADSLGTFESTLAALASESNPLEGIPLHRAARSHARPLMAAQESAAEAAQAAEHKRLSDLYAACLPGYEAARDEAIGLGSSAADFKALIVDAERAKAAKRASAIKAEATAQAILAAGKLIAGR